MIVALDVGYFDSRQGTVGVCGVVAFEQWTDDEAALEMTVNTAHVAPYVSGKFFERELPCLTAALRSYESTTGETADIVVIDGNVRLDDADKPGLGLHLFCELAESTPVMGVAKRPFRGLNATEVLRGTSSVPLLVTSAGMDEQTAAACVASMAGSFRIPTLLRRVDQLSRMTPLT